MEKEMVQILSQQTGQTRHSANRRSAFEVRMDILKVAMAGCTKPTQIMYRSNTSWMILQKNLESLIASGFIQQSADSSGTVYTVTDRGITVVRDYQNLVRLASA